MKKIVEIPMTVGGARYQRRLRSKNWAKVLTSVDRSKKDGYAFVGDFTNPGQPDELEIGAYVLRFTLDTASSGKTYEAEIALDKVTDDGLTEVESWVINPPQRWALQIRDEIADILDKATEAPADAGMTELYLTGVSDPQTVDKDAPPRTRETIPIRIVPDDNPSEWMGMTIYKHSGATMEVDGRPAVHIGGDGTVRILDA